MKEHPSAYQWFGPGLYAFWNNGCTVHMRAEWSPQRDRFVISHPETREVLGWVDVAAFNQRCFGMVLVAA
jgi:hypothetical protein